MEKTVGELLLSARQWSGVYRIGNADDVVGEVGYWKTWLAD